MFVKALFTAAFVLTTSLAQPAAPAASSSQAAATGPSPPAPSSSSTPSSTSNDLVADAERLVAYVLPSDSAPTSLSPAQASQIAMDASSFLAGYTASKPISQLQQNAAVNQFLAGGSTPTGEQQTSIGNLLAEAGTAALANPSAYVRSVEDAVNPFAFAPAVTSYAQGIFDGLATVVAHDLSLSVPTASSRSSSGAAVAHAALPTGVIGMAAFAAIGAAGVAMV